MSADTLKAKVREHGRQTRNALTAKGEGYHMVRSKFLKDKDGYGRVISDLREKLIAANGGKDPGPDVVAMHTFPGAHLGGKRDLMGKFGSRGMNTADSNRLRAHNK